VDQDTSTGEPLRVVAAALVDDLDRPTRLLAARRSTGAHAGGWELPGGKVEPDEDPHDALARELDEELALRVVLGAPVAGPLDGAWPISGAGQPGATGTLDVRLAVVAGDPPSAGPDHDELAWLPLDEAVDAVTWLPADVPVVRALVERLTLTRLVVLPERDAAEELAALLRAEGVDASAHRELLAGDDDLEDAQWVVAVEPGPASLPVADTVLVRFAEARDGWCEVHGG
jgi:8-oxo-dGTP diphosphatase